MQAISNGFGPRSINLICYLWQVFFFLPKELVTPNVHFIMDGLPFMSEDYAKAKNILMTKYGKPSEVVNAHIQNILSLLQINNANPHEIYEFSEKLQSSVQE